MPYALVADISNEFKGVDFSAASSSVKASQVQNFLDEAAAEIDGKVGMRYVLPITATGALLILKTACIDIVVERLKPMMKIDAGGTKGSQTPSNYDRKKKADAMLDGIQSNKTDLTVHGAVLRSTGDGVDSFGARNAGSCQTQTVFKKGKRQW